MQAMKMLYAKHGDMFQRPEKRIKKEKPVINNDIQNLIALHGHEKIMNLIDKDRDERFRIDYQKGKVVRKRNRKQQANSMEVIPEKPEKNIKE